MIHPLPTKKYKTILIDPPWPIPGDRNKVPYPVMPIAEIARMPIEDLMDKDCMVFLWTTNNMIEEALAIIRGWRLNYKTMITWCKNYGLGRPPYVATEHLIMATKGQPLRPHTQEGEERILNWFSTSAKPKHSQKPIEAYEIIEAISEGPGLELFARSAREGWDCWGNEAPGQSRSELQDSEDRKDKKDKPVRSSGKRKDSSSRGFLAAIQSDPVFRAHNHPELDMSGKSGRKRNQSGSPTRSGKGNDPARKKDGSGNGGSVN